MGRQNFLELTKKTANTDIKPPINVVISILSFKKIMLNIMLLAGTIKVKTLVL